MLRLVLRRCTCRRAHLDQLTFSRDIRYIERHLTRHNPSLSILSPSSHLNFSTTRSPVCSQDKSAQQPNLKKAAPNFSTCWKCQSSLASLPFPFVCPKCQTLQKYTNEMIPDYFTLLGQNPNSYKVDMSNVSLNMKRLQRYLHPDLFSNKSPEEQELSQSLSSLVNRAILTLMNPIDRGLYLLELRGVVLDLEKQLTLDSQFLGEVMELNEKLEELSNSQDWRDFREANQKELEFLETKLTKAFEKDNRDEAQVILSKMKYFENLQLKLKDIQSKFNIVD